MDGLPRHRMPRLVEWVGHAVGGMLGRAPSEDAPRVRPEPVAGSDWPLWRRAREGHAPSAEQLVRRLTPQAYGLALRLLGRSEDAEDAVQDAFVRLWRSSPSDGHDARLSTYFNTIVINRCRSARASQQELATDPEVLSDLQDAHAQLDTAATQGVGEHLAGVATGTAGARLQAAIDLLPARQRMAIAMWAYADAEVPEIARALDINANAAHQLLHRARDTLRAHFEEHKP